MSLEALFHVVDGDSDCSFSQVDDIILIKACFFHILGEGGKEEGVSPRLTKGLEKRVVFDSEVIEEYFPPIPTAGSLILGLTCCVVLTGSFPSTEKNQEFISNERGSLLKFGCS